MLQVNFDYRGGGGLSWLQWEDLMRQREQRAQNINGIRIQVRTLATMTPYDPSAGGTMPIMHYFRHGWKGTRASMKPRWPPGLLGEMLTRDKPYRTHASWVTRWILKGVGSTLSRDVVYEIWTDMAKWIEATLFRGTLSPTAQWWHYREGEGGFYGYGGNADPKIINPWEKMGGGEEIKRRASIPAQYDPRFADVYSKRGPGFLQTMWDLGPTVVK